MLQAEWRALERVDVEILLSSLKLTLYLLISIKNPHYIGS